MNDFLRKYLLLFFLFANLTAEYYLLSPISKVVFYISLAVGLLYCILNLGRINNVWKAAPFFLLWSLIYLIYQFTVGLWTLNWENILYLIARVASFAIMALCISSDPDFYLRKMARPMGYVIIVLLLIGWGYISYGGGRSYGFYNGNAGCTIAMYGASCLLFQEKLSKLDIIGLMFCLLCVVIGHSRNAVAMLFILILFRYKLSAKLFFVGILGAIVVFLLLPYLGFETESVSRIVGTINGTVEIDREDVNDYMIELIKRHPIDGNGFSFSANFINDGILGSHNGYLSTLAAMGYIFGGSWLVVLLGAVISILKYAASKDLAIRRHFAIIVSILFGAMNEAYLTGVNQIVTNLFFVSLLTISYNVKAVKTYAE